MITFPQLTPKRLGLGVVALFLLVAAISIVGSAMGPSFGTAQSLSFAPMMDASDNMVAYRTSGMAIMKGDSVGDGYAEIGVSAMPPSMMPIPTTPVPPQGDAKIVKNGDLTLLVERVDDAAIAINALRATFSGQPGNASFSEYGNGIKHGDITIWVPSERFDEAMTAIKALALRVNNEQVSVQDVSAQYVDLESRLKNLKAAEIQYQEIMKRSGKISDVLEVTRALNETRSQIEQAQGQLDYLSRQVALSSIHISLSQEDVPASVGSDWRPLSVAKTALTGLFADLTNLANMLIVFLIRLPLLVLYIGFWALLFWGFWKAGRALYARVVTDSSRGE